MIPPLKKAAQSEAVQVVLVGLAALAVIAAGAALLALNGWMVPT